MEGQELEELIKYTRTFYELFYRDESVFDARGVPIGQAVLDEWARENFDGEIGNDPSRHALLCIHIYGMLNEGRALPPPIRTYLCNLLDREWYRLQQKKRGRQTTKGRDENICLTIYQLLTEHPSLSATRNREQSVKEPSVCSIVHEALTAAGLIDLSESRIEEIWLSSGLYIDFRNRIRTE